MDDLLREFISETAESLDVVDNQLVSFEREPNNAAILASIFRLVHTIKGTCGFLGLPRLEALTHAAETLMGRFRDGAEPTAAAVTLILSTIDRVKMILDALEKTQGEPAGSDEDLIGALLRMADGTSIEPDVAMPDVAPVDPAKLVEPEPVEAKASETGEGRIADQSVRVDVDTLEHLLTMVSELVLTRNQLIDILRKQEDSEFKVPLQRLSSVTAELQDGIMKTRMQPIGNAWQKLPRLVRDLSAELGKEIALEMHGVDTELDRQVLAAIKDPLTHMVRNAADHGLEDPAERIALGKPAQATIRLSAYHEGGYVIVSVADDGRGLDTAAIKAKALAAGLVNEADLAKMSEAQIHRFIYAAGFSTASKVTSVSGRGVGLDVVRDNIDRIGGLIDVKSVKGAGTAFTIRIPLTLAIISALIVKVGGQRFALPRLAVAEILRAKGSDDCQIEHVHDMPVLRLRGKLMPLLHLGRLLRSEAGEGAYVVVMQAGHHRFGVIVDGVSDVVEIVAKPLATRLRHIAMFSGSTIMGDGSVIMIVDPNGIVRALGAAASSGEATQETNEEVEADTTSLLIFRAGTTAPRAVPLSLVMRIEEIDVAAIEMSDGRRMVQYRGKLMPLIVMDGAQLRKTGTQPVLVFVDDDDRTMGLVVDDVVDIVEEELTFDVASQSEGVIGSAVIRGQATEIVDVGHFMPLAFADHFSGPAPASSSVLLVDDSAFFRNLLATVLRAAGYRVMTAPAAREALDLLQAGVTFDAVLVDTDMPEIDGFAFAEAARASDCLHGAPMIALGATMSAPVIERGRQAGFHDHVAKFDRIGLIAALRGLSVALAKAA